MKIKVAYVIVNCKITGPMNQTLNIIKNLDRNIFTPVIITLFPEEKDNSMLDEYKKHCNEQYCLGMNKYSSVLVGKSRLTKILSQINPDIIHGLGMPPYRLSLGYKNAKHLVTLRNYCFEDYPSYYGKPIGIPLSYLDMFLIKKLSSKGEVFVTCSKSLTEIYEKKQNVSFPFIRNGVDTSRFIKSSNELKQKMRFKLGLPDDKHIFIYTGPMIDRKDQEFAIKGVLNCENSKNIYFVLCGDGTNYEELKRKYYNNSNILFTGKVSNVGEYLLASDLYISTSKSEGMPNSVLEAMAVGIPVILSDIPQHKEIFGINGDIGKLYKLEDLANLERVIDNIMSLNFQSMGEQGYKTVIENLTDKVMSKKYQNLYMDILSN